MTGLYSGYPLLRQGSLPGLLPAVPKGPGYPSYEWSADQDAEHQAEFPTSGHLALTLRDQVGIERDEDSARYMRPLDGGA
jgi:hypothetical protein